MRAGVRKGPPLVWWIVVIVTLMAASGTGYWIFSRNGDPYRTVEKLNTETYLENGNALRGNLYKIEGIVQNSLAWSEDKSRLFAIRVGNSAPAPLLPVIIPAELSGINLEKGQKIVMKVEVIEGGFIKALDAQKP